MTDLEPITVHDIAELPPKQRDVLGQLCLDNDLGHHSKTLEALERKGLATWEYQTLPGRFPVKIKRWTFSCWAAHIAWCAWCSEHGENEP